MTKLTHYPSFIDKNVCQILIAKEIPLSRYFVQRIHRQIGKYDKILIENGNIQLYSSKPSWASNLPIPVYLYLISEGAKQYKDLPFNGNDLELFSFLTASPTFPTFPNIDSIYSVIKDLILNKRFVPFPPRPHLNYLQIQTEKFPSDDGFENISDLNMIAKAIVIHPKLVNEWKKIGYYEICNDYNDLVFQQALLMLLPSSLVTYPATNVVISRLNEFISLGFKLHDKAIINILKRFKDRLCDIGAILLDAFFKIRSGEFTNIATFLDVLRKSAMQEREELDALLNFLQYMKIKYE